MASMVADERRVAGAADIASIETDSMLSDATVDLPLPVVHKERRPNAPTTFPWRRLAVAALIGTTGVCALAAAGFRSQSAAQSAMRADRTAAVQSGFFAQGRLEPLGRIVSVGAPEGVGAARVKRLLVSEGKRVAASERLAILDNEDRLLAELNTARNRVAQGEAKLRLTALATASSKAELTAKAKGAEASAAAAATRFERIRNLISRSATSRQDLEEAQRDFDTASEAVHQVKAALMRYGDGDAGDSADVVVAREELAVAKATLKESEIRAAQAYVVAPAAGTVLELHVREGEALQQRPLLDMGFTDVMTARMEVYETDVRRTFVGQSVRLASAAVERPLAAKVDSLGLVVRRQTNVRANPAANTDARVVEIVVRLDGESSAVARNLVGLQVRGEFPP